jgi:RNA polymerase sigma-19 factor, ECF subfamily
MDLVEAIIIRKLKEGDEETYKKLFRDYYISLCMYALRYLGRKDLAEDIVSETYYILWKNRDKLEINVSLKSYLFQAVCNNSLSYLRKMQKEEKLEDNLLHPEIGINQNTETTGQLPLEYLINKDLGIEIQKALDRLPKQQKTVFRLKRFEGKKNREIAKILGLSEKTVEMHFHNANLKMQKFLKDYFNDLVIFYILLSFLN